METGSPARRAISVNDRTSQSLKVSRIAETLLVTDWPGSVEFPATRPHCPCSSNLYMNTCGTSVAYFHAEAFVMMSRSSLRSSRKSATLSTYVVVRFEGGEQG